GTRRRPFRRPGHLLGRKFRRLRPHHRGQQSLRGLRLRGTARGSRLRRAPDQYFRRLSGAPHVLPLASYRPARHGNPGGPAGPRGNPCQSGPRAGKHSVNYFGIVVPKPLTEAAVWPMFGYGGSMRRIASFTICLTLVAAVSAQQRKRVAVMDFDYGTVRTSVAALFGTDQDVGKGITDLIVDKLVNDGVYSVIERKQLDKIIKEQNFSNSDRADPASAAKIARILGVDAIIVGSITQFGRDDKSTAVGGGAASSTLNKFGIGGVKTSKATAVCTITARMIDTSTAEILASVQGHGEESRSGTGVVGSGGSWGNSGGGGLDMRSSNFGNTILGAAVAKATSDVAH